jgi:hypothetical protein
MGPGLLELQPSGLALPVIAQRFLLSEFQRPKAKINIYWLPISVYIIIALIRKKMAEPLNSNNHGNIRGKRF